MADERIDPADEEDEDEQYRDDMDFEQIAEDYEEEGDLEAEDAGFMRGYRKEQRQEHKRQRKQEQQQAR